MLKEAGIPENLKVTLSVRNVTGYPDHAVLVKEQFKKYLGWDIDIKAMEAGAGFDTFWTGDWQFMIQRSVLNNTTPDAVHAKWATGTVAQWVGGGRGKFFAVDGVKELFDKQKVETDQEKHKTLIKKIEDTLYNGGSATATIWWDMRAHPFDNRIQNFHFTDNGMTWEHVWCDPAC